MQHESERSIKNRMKLADFLYSKKNFTLNSLMKGFAKINKGDLWIGEPIKTWIENLRAVGVLSCRFGRYHVIVS